MAEMSPRRVNKELARLVRDHVRATADDMAAKAEGLLADHRQNGAHHIEVSQGKVDAFVSLVGPAALSVEEGHFAGHKGERTRVEGLHILRRAAGLQ